MMDRTRKLRLPLNVGNVRERALNNVVRPSAEALLLAAVALGCAQAGWNLLTPNSASAVDTVSRDSHNDTSLDLAEVQSPFAPHAAGSGAGSHAIEALVSGIELKGIRLADDHARSGAMLLLGDGAERAFLLGQEVADGLTLAEVDPDYILLAYDGGQRRLEMSAGPSYSFARAMMGLEQAPGAPVGNVQPVASGRSYARAILGLDEAPEPQARTEVASEDNSAQAPVAQAREQAAPASLSSDAFEQSVSRQDYAWLAASLARIEMVDGEAVGWRIQAPPPGAQAVGLRPNDLVLSVNGAGPSDLSRALEAARAQQLALVIQRGGERVQLTLNIDQRT